MDEQIISLKQENNGEFVLARSSENEQRVIRIILENGQDFKRVGTPLPPPPEPIVKREDYLYGQSPHHATLNALSLYIFYPLEKLLSSVEYDESWTTSISRITVVDFLYESTAWFLGYEVYTILVPILIWFIGLFHLKITGIKTVDGILSIAFLSKFTDMSCGSPIVITSIVLMSVISWFVWFPMPYNFNKESLFGAVAFLGFVYKIVNNEAHNLHCGNSFSYIMTVFFILGAVFPTRRHDPEDTFVLYIVRLIGYYIRVFWIWVILNTFFFFKLIPYLLNAIFTNNHQLIEEQEIIQ